MAAAAAGRRWPPLAAAGRRWLGLGWTMANRHLLTADHTAK
jgi:hypothetical protein